MATRPAQPPDLDLELGLVLETAQAAARRLLTASRPRDEIVLEQVLVVELLNKLHRRTLPRPFARERETRS